MAAKGHLLPVGKIIKAHGIKGELKVIVYNQDVSQFAAYRQVYLPKKFGFSLYPVKKVRGHGRYVLLTLEGVEDRTSAENLIGLEIFIDKRSLPPLQDGEYYWYQLYGLRVVTKEGKDVGTIRYIFNNGAHDIYVVKNNKDDGEILIPATDEIILDIDLEQGIMKIDPLPGLIEANEN